MDEFILGYYCLDNCDFRICISFKTIFVSVISLCVFIAFRFFFLFVIHRDEFITPVLFVKSFVSISFIIIIIISLFAFQSFLVSLHSILMNYFRYYYVFRIVFVLEERFVFYFVVQTLIKTTVWRQEFLGFRILFRTTNITN